VVIYRCAALELLERIPDCSLDAAATDPPYGLGFMGKAWDKTLPDPRTWSELLRVLKPGSHAVIFGAPKLDHRLAVNVEDAGFEIRDKLMWLFGSGFPKGGNITEDHGILLKPAYETILLVRKPLDGTVRENVLEWDTGVLNIAACRVDGGRWPANVIMDEAAGSLLDAMVGRLRSGSSSSKTPRGQNSVFGKAGGTGTLPDRAGDAGGALRFFYCPKASTEERELGLEHRPAVAVGDGRKTAANNAYQRGKKERRNPHTTVKPIALMRWLVRLITPVGGLVIDPFVGSGTTAIAAALEDRDFIGCDLDEDYVSVAQDRVEYWKGKRS
jgi:hypothetical protein